MVDILLVGGDWNMTGLFFYWNVVIPIDSYFSGFKPPTRWEF